MVDQLAAWAQALPSWAVYLGLGLGAAVENIVPAVPADTFVLLGGFFSALNESLHAWGVFLATWLLNAASALLMYRLGHTHGRPFFETGWGRRLLNAHQMERMQAFYHRWGTPAIFFTRFLPGLRAVVPVFAGVTHQPVGRVAVPIVAASAIWYGALVRMGAMAGENLEAVERALGEANHILLGAAVVVAGAAFGWWWRTRRHDD
ncbi:MAG: DedA family protein [Gemmatimonadota bacterium]